MLFKKVLNGILCSSTTNTNAVIKIRKGRKKSLFAPYAAFFFFLPVFDDEDENKLSYTDIHVQYKKLVSADICFAGQQCPAWCLINITHHWVFGLHTHRPGLTKPLCLRRWRSCWIITCRRLASMSSSFWRPARHLLPSPKRCRYVKPPPPPPSPPAWCVTPRLSAGGNLRGDQGWRCPHNLVIFNFWQRL